LFELDVSEVNRMSNVFNAASVLGTRVTITVYVCVAPLSLVTVTAIVVGDPTATS
jgi:hypothetical protein